jgi:predicted nucleic acid-binding protein
VAVIADTSVVVDYLDGRSLEAMDTAVWDETLILSPIVIAEVLSGSDTSWARQAMLDFFRDLPMHQVGRSHWMAVGVLRRDLKGKEINVTIPDAHIAQCAIDLDATLIIRDKIFRLIAGHIPLRLA